MLIGSLRSAGQDWDEWYPDDLPEEWRLDYFANEFRAVLISESEWLSWEDAGWKELDWPEHLSVFVEVSSSTVAQWLSWAGVFDEKGLAPHAYICSDVDALSLVTGTSLLKSVDDDGGWSAGDGTLVVSAIYQDPTDLKALRYQIEASDAWKAPYGVLLFEASAGQLDSINTLVELLA